MAQRLEKAQRELDLLKPVPNKSKDAYYYKTLLDRYFGPDHVLSKESTMLMLQRSLSAGSYTLANSRRFLDQQFPSIKFSPSVLQHSHVGMPSQLSNIHGLQEISSQPLAMSGQSSFSQRQVPPQQLNLSTNSRLALTEDSMTDLVSHRIGSDVFVKANACSFQNFNAKHI